MSRTPLDVTCSSQTGNKALSQHGKYCDRVYGIHEPTDRDRLSVGRVNRSSSGGSLIDVHVHLYSDQRTGLAAKNSYEVWEYGDDPGVDFDTSAGVIGDLGARYEDAGFDHAVVLQLFDVPTARASAMAHLQEGLTREQRIDSESLLEEALAVALMEANHWVVKTAATHPLLTAFVCIDPVLLAQMRIDTHLRELASMGARGVKLHPVSQGYRPDDDRLNILYELCCELDLVVLSHSGPGHHSGASATPSEFARVLEQWPNLRLVLAHLGGASWSEAAELADAFPQVVFDASEIIDWTGAENAPTRTQLADLISRIGADRVMLGSDFPWYEPQATADKLYTLPGLGPLERSALMGDTAMRLLDLELCQK